MKYKITPAIPGWENNQDFRFFAPPVAYGGFPQLLETLCVGKACLRQESSLSQRENTALAYRFASTSLTLHTSLANSCRQMTNDK